MVRQRLTPKCHRMEIVELNERGFLEKEPVSIILPGPTGLFDELTVELLAWDRKRRERKARED
jgi:hypothetical protein